MPQLQRLFSKLKVRIKTIHSVRWLMKYINSFFKNKYDPHQKLQIYIQDLKIDTVIDVGANVGLYSLYAKFLQNTNFYSFEPFKKTFDVLNKNIELNNITNVKTFNIGLSDKKETKELKISFDNNGLNTLGDNPLRFNTDDVILIEVDTIDNLFYHKNIEVNYIKIDTEGFEYYILTGAKKTIEKYKPIIQIEYNITNMKQCNIEPEQIEKIINDLNYKIAFHTNEELIIIPNSYYIT
jgi:FkbM family methyltransferase